jgi:hypothetical protein
MSMTMMRSSGASAANDPALLDRIAKQAQRDEDWCVLGYRNHTVWGRWQPGNVRRF